MEDAVASNVTMDAESMSALVQALLEQLYASVAPSLLHEHRLVLALRLVQVRGCHPSLSCSSHPPSFFLYSLPLQDAW